jgi:nucleotide-binding universal stress UspA family protein
MSTPATHRIVVGLDGSERGRAALVWAGDRAHRLGAELEVIHAWQPPDIGGFGLAPETLALVEAEAHETLDNEVRSVPEQVHVSARVVAGSASGALLDASEGADMLVVGDRSHEGITGFLVGSTTDQCLHHAHVPIAVVRPEARAGDPPKIVVGVDGSDVAARALRWALDEARAIDARVTVVHAWDFVLAGGLPAPTVGWIPADLDKASEALVDAVLAEADLHGLVAPVERVSQCGSAAAVLMKAATDADMIVVGRRGTGGFRALLLGSVSTQVARQAATTVVVVP